MSWRWSGTRIKTPAPFKLPVAYTRPMRISTPSHHRQIGTSTVQTWFKLCRWLSLTTTIEKWGTVLKEYLCLIVANDSHSCVISSGMFAFYYVKNVADPVNHQKSEPTTKYNHWLYLGRRFLYSTSSLGRLPSVEKKRPRSRHYTAKTYYWRRWW